jgi:hypothetical protein
VIWWQALSEVWPDGPSAQSRWRRPQRLSVMLAGHRMISGQITLSVYAPAFA